MHWRVCWDCDPWPQPLHGSAVDQQCNLSPPHNRPLHQTNWGVRLPAAKQTNVGCALCFDSGIISMPPECNGSYSGRSRVCPCASFPAKCVQRVSWWWWQRMESMVNQVATLTYQSQSTASTTATTTQHNKQKLAAIKATQHATHASLHQIIAQLNAVTFNQSDAGCGCFVGHGHGRATRRGFAWGNGGGPPPYVGSDFQGGGFSRSPPPPRGGFPPGGGFQGGFPGGPAQPPTYVPPGGLQDGPPQVQQSVYPYWALAGTPG